MNKFKLLLEEYGTYTYAWAKQCENVTTGVRTMLSKHKGGIKYTCIDIDN
jgi:hypothetical protein